MNTLWSHNVWMRIFSYPERKSCGLKNIRIRVDEWICTNEYARAKRAKILFFIVKYANLWGFLLPSSSWLLKLPIIILCTLLIHLTRCNFTQMAGYFRFETPWHFWAIMNYLTRQVCQLIFWERLKDMNSLAPRRGQRGDEHRRIHGIKPLSVFLRVETG